MTAPMSLREYFAAAGSAFTKQDAEVIGPQLEAMADEGEVTERTIVDTARSANSPLHGYFDWNDQSAADRFRLHQAAGMMRSIRVRFVEDSRPRTAPAYRIAREQPKSVFKRHHNVLHGNSAAAVRKAQQAMDELIAWRARYQPYVIVWEEFADIFQGVANQIAEAEDEVHLATLGDHTDEALTHLLAGCAAWQAKHAGTASTWYALAEQARFLIKAVDEAFVRLSSVGARERACLRCGTAFQSGGKSHRLCEGCG